MGWMFTCHVLITWYCVFSHVWRPFCTCKNMHEETNVCCTIMLNQPFQQLWRAHCCSKPNRQPSSLPPLLLQGSWATGQLSHGQLSWQKWQERFRLYCITTTLHTGDCLRERRETDEFVDQSALWLHCCACPVGMVKLHVSCYVTK